MIRKYVWKSMFGSFCLQLQQWIHRLIRKLHTFCVIDWFWVKRKAINWNLKPNQWKATIAATLAISQLICVQSIDLSMNSSILCFIWSQVKLEFSSQSFVSKRTHNLHKFQFRVKKKKIRISVFHPKLSFHIIWFRWEMTFFGNKFSNPFSKRYSRFGCKRRQTKWNLNYFSQHKQWNCFALKYK